MERHASHRAIAWCFGLGLFQHLALCQPNCHPANTSESFYRKPPVILQHLAKCQIQLARCQKYPTWPSSVTTDPIPYFCDRNWPRKGIYSWIIDLDLWPWVTKNQSFADDTYLYAKYGGRRSNGSTFFGAETWTILRKYIWISTDFLGLGMFGFRNMLIPKSEPHSDL